MVTLSQFVRSDSTWEQSSQYLGEHPADLVVVMSEVGETPPAELLGVVNLTGLDQPESLLQHLQPLPPTSSTDNAHLLNDGLLHQRDQPGQHQPVGQLNDAKTGGKLHRRRLVSVEVVQELLEC